MKPVVIRLRRDLPHEVADAFAWLTDFEEKDAQRAGAVVETRRILERTPERVVYEGEQRILGRPAFGRVEVLLHPPDHWEARVIAGPGRGGVYRYRLESARRGSRLHVEYGIAVRSPKQRVILLLSKPLLKRSLHRMWDGYVASMMGEVPIREWAAAAAPMFARR